MTKLRRSSRRLAIESLESRRCLASLQNPLVAEDVNDDGAISPIDALQIINHLNEGQSPAGNSSESPSLSYLDVTGDQVIAPLDVLRVINKINAGGVQRMLDTVVDAGGVVRGKVETSGAAIVTAKAKIDRLAVIDVLVNEDGTFAFFPGQLGELRTAINNVTLYLKDSDGGTALRQLVVNLAADQALQFTIPDRDIDTLEDQPEMLTVTYLDGTLAVQGTDDPNRIDIIEIGGAIKINNVQLQLQLADIRVLGIVGQGGDDAIWVHGPGDVETITIIDGGAGNDQITSSFGKNLLGGGDGNDMIFAWSSQSHVVYGGAGDDHISASDADDELFGNDGDDLIFAEGGHDSVDGGTGDDAIYGGEGDDWITGGDGADELYGDEGIDLIDGGFGDDHVLGGDDGDILSGASGADTLEGGRGDDRIEGGSDPDRIWGNDGNDWLDGGGSSDEIHGGVGDDVIRGSSGADELHGDEGNDVITGGSSADEAFGGPGNDTLRGGDGDDMLWGDSGNDKLDGDDDVDELFGGDGNDELYGYSIGSELFGFDMGDGGPGDDESSINHIDGQLSFTTILALGLWATTLNTSTDNVVTDPGGFEPPVNPGFSTVWNVPINEVIVNPSFSTRASSGFLATVLGPQLYEAIVIEQRIPTSPGSLPLSSGFFNDPLI